MIKVIIHISRAVSIFYGTEIEIWAGFWPDGGTEKKYWADYEQLEIPHCATYV